MPKAKTVEKQETIYRIKFVGTYFSTDPSVVGGTRGFGPIEVKMNERMVKEGVLSVFKNEIAPRKLAAMFSDYSYIATYKQVEVHALDGSAIKNINLMNRAELEALIGNEELLIDVTLYKSADELRQALFDYIDDESGFLYNQDIRRTKINPTAKLVPDLLALNPDLAEDTKALTDELEGKVHNEIPSLSDILASQKAMELEEARAKAKAAMATNVNTTGIEDLSKAKQVQVRGYTDTITDDTYPDGQPTYGGKKGKNPLGNF